jgi:hypothetical protein
MTRSCVKLMTCGATAVVLLSSTVANAQILDRLRGRETRTRGEESPIERNYVPPNQGDRAEYRDSEGRVIRGEAEYRSGDRTQTRNVSRARRGTMLIGSTVRFEGNRTLGRVDDIVIGESGCVEYMVVSVSGLRGMSGRMAVVPYSVGELDFSRRTVYVDWGEEDLRRAPIFFTAGSWPDFEDSRWSGEVTAYFEHDSRGNRSSRGEIDSRDSDRGRYDERPSRRDTRDRVDGRDENRSYRESDSRSREDRNRSDVRSHSYDEDRDEHSDRANSNNGNRDRSDRDRSTRTRESDRDSSNRTKNQDSNSDDDSDYKSSNRKSNSDKPQ